MQTAGVICEYNPFHLGHARQLELIRQQLGQEAAIVCLMSGNYVQRGEPAVFDKCVRARAAVEAGASLVLELPVTYALRSADTAGACRAHPVSLSVTEVLCAGDVPKRPVGPGQAARIMTGAMLPAGCDCVLRQEDTDMGSPVVEIYAALNPISNREEIFGAQLLMDAEDNELGRLEKLLSNATFLSIDDAPALAARYGGFCYPAHIDRDSMSVLAALGEVPDHLGFHTVEVADPEKFFIGGRNASYPEKYHILTCSDAHRTEALLPDASHAIHLPECTFEALKAVLTTPKGSAFTP